MGYFSTRLKHIFSTRFTQAAVFIGLVVITALCIALQASWGAWLQRGPKSAHVQPPNKAVHAADLTVHAELSQTKLVQGQTATVYVNLGIQTPTPIKLISAGNAEHGGALVSRAPTDLVVVLDRSPSMLAANKLPYAKAAVLELIQKLGPADRLGLIGFDRSAKVYVKLSAVTPEARPGLREVVQHMTVGSATNIGAGLGRARDMLGRQPSERIKKIMLLSDGETNTGITDPQALAKMASEISDHNIILSTIGMGLGFNEALMAALADHGMGHYAYLEHLDTLGEILAKDLDETRSLYAERSALHLELSDGVKLVDAAGYPIERLGGSANHLRVKTGQLLWGARKPLMLTLQVPAAASGDFALGDIALYLRSGGIDKKTVVPHEQLVYAVVEPTKKQEAVASIRRDVYRKSWLQNNLGRMRKEVSSWIKAGNRPQAQAVIDDYRRKLDDAEATSGMPIKDKAVEQDITHMESELKKAFQGSAAEQAERQNRLSKSMQYRAREEQRK